MRSICLLLLLLVGCQKPASRTETPASPEVARKLYVVCTLDTKLTVLNPESGLVYNQIEVGWAPYQVVSSPDSRWLYCSVESKNQVLKIDPLRDRVVGAIDCPSRPQSLAFGPEGRWLYVALLNEVGVIDPATDTLVKTMPVGKVTHNCYLPRNGKHVYVTSIYDRLTKVYDADHRLVNTLKFEENLRPIAVTTDETRLFAALEKLHGFVELTLPEGRQVARVEHPPPKRPTEKGYIPTHGIELRPPQEKELWVTSFQGHAMLVYDVTTSPASLIGEVEVGEAPNHLSFSSDGRYVYVGNFGSNDVSVIDCEARQEIARYPTGQGPKRTLEARIPMEWLRSDPNPPADKPL